MESSDSFQIDGIEAANGVQESAKSSSSSIEDENDS